jgi:H+-transporting ATPase
MTATALPAMDVTLERPVITPAPVPVGLTSAEAACRLAEFGPNAVVEERVYPLLQAARHFWAPVPWMLEATIALQIAIAERLEAAMIAALLILNVALGVFQENRAGAALALLKQRLATEGEGPA